MKTINKILIGIGIITVAKGIKNGIENGIEYIHTEIEKKKIDAISDKVAGLSNLAKDMNDKNMDYDKLIERLKNMGFKKKEKESE